MLRPKIPTMPTPTGLVSRPAVVEPTTVVQHAPAQTAPVAPASSSRPTVQLTPGSLLALVGGGTAVVLVVGTVLVSMLLAVAVTAASVAVCALVIRSLISSQHRR
ncbi:SpdD-like protein [Streptomyces sp. MBT67]|uniref:SpdD-like protein n=1 Tax=unclassified Streptomyces TaxID=2593676 RepID=UPI00190AAD28|nr:MULTISPECIES: SpdD-like protein [unclassified Streptomyces]MBK3528663.1 SpdD-like protein [Streptomyces sp. MBT72]MBK3535002.1 SpdD-like protein [Streptomyces sp. MBT67]MBK3548882.1 SpdD-like protein [Streptomyces sp. MBT61]MBK6026986.1 SpdD-like protein [Streptomyces sp. MBT59]